MFLSLSDFSGECHGDWETFPSGSLLYAQGVYALVAWVSQPRSSHCHKAGPAVSPVVKYVSDSVQGSDLSLFAAA